MKVSIIGGGGLVGSCAAFALQCGGIAREIALLDVNQELAIGQALDLQHGSPSVADQAISGGGYEHIPCSDVIGGGSITADGLLRWNSSHATSLSPFVLQGAIHLHHHPIILKGDFFFKL